MRSRPGRTLLAPNARFRVQKWDLSINEWGERPPLRIGILSDLHWGYRPISPAFVDRVKARLQAMSPDLILFLGDLAEGGSDEAKFAHMEQGALAMAGLTAPLGLYAVLGNHDWHDDPATHDGHSSPVSANRFLEQAGFKVLENTALRPGRDDIWLGGLASQQAFKGKKGAPKRRGADDLPATLADAPGEDPMILLAHEPDLFPDIEDPRVVLTLSGHMHAGQVRLLGRAFYAPSRHGTRYDYGRFDENGRTLIVSGGLGCSTLPIRIGIVPEITLVEVRGAGDR